MALVRVRDRRAAGALPLATRPVGMHRCLRQTARLLRMTRERAQRPVGSDAAAAPLGTGGPERLGLGLGLAACPRPSPAQQGEALRLGAPRLRPPRRLERRHIEALELLQRRAPAGGAAAADGVQVARELPELLALAAQRVPHEQLREREAAHQRHEQREQRTQEARAAPTLDAEWRARTHEATRRVEEVEAVEVVLREARARLVRRRREHDRLARRRRTLQASLERGERLLAEARSHRPHGGRHDRAEVVEGGVVGVVEAEDVAELVRRCRFEVVALEARRVDAHVANGRRDEQKQQQHEERTGCRLQSVEERRAKDAERAAHASPTRVQLLPPRHLLVRGRPRPGRGAAAAAAAAAASAASAVAPAGRRLAARRRGRRLVGIGGRPILPLLVRRLHDEHQPIQREQEAEQPHTEQRQPEAQVAELAEGVELRAESVVEVPALRRIERHRRVADRVVLAHCHARGRAATRARPIIHRSNLERVASAGVVEDVGRAQRLVVDLGVDGDLGQRALARSPTAGSAQGAHVFEVDGVVVGRPSVEGAGDSVGDLPAIDEGDAQIGHLCPTRLRLLAKALDQLLAEEWIDGVSDPAAEARRVGRVGGQRPAEALREVPHRAEVGIRRSGLQRGDEKNRGRRPGALHTDHSATRVGFWWNQEPGSDQSFTRFSRQIERVTMPSGPI